MAFSANGYSLYQGSLYLAERTLNGGFLTGFDEVGDVDMYSIDPTQKFEDIEESQTGGGFTAAHIPVSTSMKVKFRALDGKMANWVRATWGGTAGSVTGASASGESIVLYNGMMTPLLHPGVSNVVISGAVLGTDYTVDAVNGAIKVLASSSTIPDGTPLSTTVSYDYATYNGKIHAFTTGQRYYTARLHARDTAKGNAPFLVVTNQIAFDMAKTFNLIGKKHFEMEMDGMCLQDTLIPIPVLPTDPSQFMTVTRG